MPVNVFYNLKYSVSIPKCCYLLELPEFLLLGLVADFWIAIGFILTAKQE